MNMRSTYQGAQLCKVGDHDEDAVREGLDDKVGGCAVDIYGFSADFVGVMRQVIARG